MVHLKLNDMLGWVEGHALPITCDSGAEITVVPEECIAESQFKGESCMVSTFNNSKAIGKQCNVKIHVGDRVFTRTAVTQPGDDISWSACLSLDLSDDEDTKFLIGQLKLKDQKEDELHYMPPRMEQGKFNPAIMVSQGNVVEAE